MKMRNKNEDAVKKVSKLQASQDANVGWWNKLTENEKIAMGLRQPYYVPTKESFRKTAAEKLKLKDLKKVRTAIANRVIGHFDKHWWESQNYNDQP